MSEVLTVEVVGKFGPKINGKWYGVKRPLKSTDFVAGSSYEVETEGWESNGKSGVNIVSAKKVETQEVVKDVKKERKEKQVDALSYDEQKNRRILRQGLTQAVAQSPLLAGLPFTNASEAVALIKEVTNALIEFVEEK